MNRHFWMIGFFVCATITERLAKAKADPKLFVNREIFNQFSAEREAEFEEKLAKLRASSR